MRKLTAVHRSSYVEDPKWQRRFSAVWAIAAVVAILASLPYFIHSVKNGRAFAGLLGLSEDLHGKHYTPIAAEEKHPAKKRRRIVAWAESALASLRWSLPGIELSFGQSEYCTSHGIAYPLTLGIRRILVLVTAGYLATLVYCITKDSVLITNPNRAGFLALAQLPVVFLFATKNSVLSLLLGPGNGYEKLNYIHRWSGRGMFLGAVIHGSLWIRNHLQYGLPILGQQKETSGVACFALLGILVLTSLRPVRRLLYQAFWIVQ